MKTRSFIVKLDQLLSPLGFTRHATTWNRLTGSVVEVIDLQISKAGDAMTFNAGVLDPEVHTRVWRNQRAAFVEEPDCTVRARIGQLIDGRDKWWQAGDEAEEVALAVATHVLPFLERTRTREAMREWLMNTGVVKKGYPPPIASLAIIMNLLGETAEACEVMRELRQKAGGEWRTRLADIAQELGCE